MNNMRRFIPVCLAVLATVLLATVLSACGSSVKTYTDSSYGYSFTYPAEWKLQTSVTSDATAGNSSAGAVAVYDSEGTVVDKIHMDLAMVMVYELTVTVHDPWSSDIRAKLEGLVTDLKSQASDAKIEQALEQTTKAGLKGYAVTLTFTKGDTPMRSTLYFLFDGTLEYQVTQQAAIATWQDAKPALDGIVATFKPGAAK